MARKKGTARTVTIVDDDEDDEPTETTAQAAADFAQADKDEGGALIRITDELRATAGARVQIVRTYPSTPDLAGHVGDMTPDEYSAERVRQLYGPGRYRIRFVGPNGYMPGGGALHIAKLREDGPASTAGAGTVSEVAALIKAMRETDEARAKESAARRDRLIELAIPGGLSLLTALLTKGSGSDSQLTTALITAFKPQQQMTMQDMLALMVKVQELQRPQETGDQLDKLEKIIGIAKQLGGDSDSGGDTWIGFARELVKEGLPAARAAIEAMTQSRQAATAPQVQIQPRVMMPGPAAPTLQAQPSAPAAQQPQVPASAPMAAADPNPKPGDDMLAMFMPMIREQAARILRWAAQDRNPAAYAEVFLDELPEYVGKYITPPKALEWLQSPNWWAVLLERFPEAAAHEKWLDEFRQELIDVLSAEMRASERGEAAQSLQDTGQDQEAEQ